MTFDFYYCILSLSPPRGIFKKEEFIDNNNSAIKKRLQIINGHVRKIKNMVDNGEYCINILHQSQAVQAALKKVDNLILQNHLNGCVVDAIKKGKKAEVIKEVMEVFQKNK